MFLITIIARTVPYIWIGINIFLLVKSYILNEYKLFGGDQWKMFEHSDKVFPLMTENLAHYDISEFLFFCIVPIYLYMLAKKLIASIFAKG
jgi:hypothetical protein